LGSLREVLAVGELVDIPSWVVPQGRSQRESNLLGVQICDVLSGGAWGHVLLRLLLTVCHWCLGWISEVLISRSSSLCHAALLGKMG
jgi:hypothetical protein